MLLKAFTIYDSKAHYYFTPFFLRNKGEALRAFADTVNDVKSNLFKYPEDFALFEIGDFDEASGSLIPYTAHISLGKAIEFKSLPVNDSNMSARS